MFYGGGKICIIPGRSIIIHQPKETNTGFLKYEPLDGTEPIDACQKFLQACDYSGLFSIELLRGIDGIDYFMEINFRNDGNAISVTDAGINLPYIWYLYCKGYDYSGEIKLPSNTFVMPEFTILTLWYHRELSTVNAIKAFLLTDSFMDYAKDDPDPTNGFRIFVKNFIKLLPRRIVKFMLNRR